MLIYMIYYTMKLKFGNCFFTVAEKTEGYE